MKMTTTRMKEICDLVTADNELPTLDDITKEELLLYGKIATEGTIILMKKLRFWKKLCYILGGIIVLSVLIDLLKLAEVI